MRTTVNIPDGLLEQAKDRSFTEGRSLGSLVADGLRILLAQPKQAEGVPKDPLPTFGTGGTLPGVDLDSHGALLDLMEGA